MQLKLSDFQTKLDSYNSEQDYVTKAEILNKAMTLLLEIENISDRYKSFIKSSGLNEVRLDLEIQISSLKKKGCHFTSKSQIPSPMYYL